MILNTTKFKSSLDQPILSYNSFIILHVYEKIRYYFIAYISDKYKLSNQAYSICFSRPLNNENIVELIFK